MPRLAIEASTIAKGNAVAKWVLAVCAGLAAPGYLISGLQGGEFDPMVFGFLALFAVGIPIFVYRRIREARARDAQTEFWIQQEKR